MKLLDYFLQSWRIRRASDYIQEGARVLDIGCADGALFRFLGKRIGKSVGMDPELGMPEIHEKYELIRGCFPQQIVPNLQFDVIVMLAVLEHVPFSDTEVLALNCSRYLVPGGILIITVPSPQVDQILDVLKFLKLIDGMSLEQHHGFQVEDTTRIFSEPRFKLVVRKKFQMGLNNLFVFKKIADLSNL